jgi:hypothetical protein
MSSDSRNIPKNLSKADKCKRARKGADDATISKGIDLGNLLEELPTSVVDELRQVLGSSEITNRDLISAAVSSHLPQIVRNLQLLGFEPHRESHQRPRAFDAAAWTALERSEALVGISKIQLLRAAIILLAREGPGSVSLRKALEEIEGEQTRPERHGQTSDTRKTGYPTQTGSDNANSGG